MEKINKNHEISINLLKLTAYKKETNTLVDIEKIL